MFCWKKKLYQMLSFHSLPEDCQSHRFYKYDEEIKQMCTAHNINGIKNGQIFKWNEWEFKNLLKWHHMWLHEKRAQPENAANEPNFYIYYPCEIKENSKSKTTTITFMPSPKYKYNVKDMIQLISIKEEAMLVQLLLGHHVSYHESFGYYREYGYDWINLQILYDRLTQLLGGYFYRSQFRIELEPYCVYTDCSSTYYTTDRHIKLYLKLQINPWYQYPVYFKIYMQRMFLWKPENKTIFEPHLIQFIQSYMPPWEETWREHEFQPLWIQLGHQVDQKNINVYK